MTSSTRRGRPSCTGAARRRQCSTPWVDVLTERAGDLVDGDTVADEAASISAYFETDQAS